MVPVRTIRVLERVRRTCLLGVRFWDPLTQGFLNEGLVLTAEPSGQPGARRTAVPNRQGGLVFPALPGMRRFEIAEDEPDEALPSPPAPREFTLRMEDPLERFLPMRFQATAPVDGWAGLGCDSSPPDRPADSLPLFSSPARTLGGRLAVVRADLWNASSDRPAAWALLEVQADTPAGSTFSRGMADEDGRVVVAFAYPEMPPPPAPASPPSPRTGLSAQSWDLALSVRFAGLPGTRRRPQDLCVILGQAHGTLLQQQSPAQPLTGGTLLYGQELVLRTSGDAQGRLLVLPG